MKTKLLTLICIAAITAGSVHAQSAATLESQIKALQTQVAALNNQLLSVQRNPALQLGPFVSVDPSPENGVIGPHITFKGVNVHIISGRGYTNDNITGLGNLLIGYNEAGVGELSTGDRGGSHNLVLGTNNKFRVGSYGGIINGDYNTITCEENVALGGGGNTVTGSYAVVIGGSSNNAATYLSAVVGGLENTTGGEYQLLLGGSINTLTATEFQVAIGANNVTP